MLQPFFYSHPYYQCLFCWCFLLYTMLNSVVYIVLPMSKVCYLISHPFQVISKDTTLAEQSQETEFIINEYFDSLGKTVMTLMQFVTLDSLATIYFPLIVARPALLCYFLPILVFVSIGLMNLVTAVSWLCCFAISVKN